ncbi:MAG: NUDIX domain-containing protein, partial [Calditrichota bacterium]
MIIPVLAAIIRDDQNRLLIAKRKSGLPRGGYWEFPGGKLQSGESPEEGI